MFFFRRVGCVVRIKGREFGSKYSGGGRGASVPLSLGKAQEEGGINPPPPPRGGRGSTPRVR